MTQLFLVLCLWSISVSYAKSEILSSLKKQNFSCKEISQGPCIYHECLGNIPSYPRPILISVPTSAKSLRVHFHGHILGQYPEYETSLESMLGAFHLRASLCSSSEVTAFPSSEGKCATYDKFLKTSANMELFLQDLYSALGQNFTTLHVSAHSGGGRALSRMLESKIPVSEVSLFDGTYSEGEILILKNWYEQGNGDLTLATVKGISPDQLALKLKQLLNLKMPSVSTELSGTNYEVSQKDRLIHLRRDVGSDGALKAHYQTLTQTWAFTP